MERPARKDQTPGRFSPMQVQVCSQQWFDPMLRDLAASFPCVTLLHRCRLDRFRLAGGGVIAEVTHLDSGAPERIEARYLAACDGANSMVRDQLGIALDGAEVLSRPVHAFFRAPDLLDRLGMRPGTFFLAIDRGGLWANLRIVDPADGLWRLMVLDTPAGFEPGADDLERWLRRALGRPYDVAWAGLSVWVRRGVVAECYSDGPVLLAGDAVHQLSPTGALGMNTGIGDAVDLGWKLAARIEGWGGPGLLASYESERRLVGRRNVAMATAFYQGHRAFEGGIDAIEDATPRGAAVRRELGAVLMRDIARMFRTKGLQLGYCYAGSPVCLPDALPEHRDDAEAPEHMARSGARAPHAWLGDGRSTLDLFGSGFVLLRFGDEASDPGPLAAAAAARRVPFEAIDLAHEDDARHLYRNALVLVRPDGHIAWHGDELPADAQALIDTVRGG